jgi:hypothetical protein
MAASMQCLAIVFAVALFQRAVQSADALNKLAQQTGVNVSTLSELQFGANHVSVEFSAVEQVICVWNATLVEASQNVNSRALIALRSMGVELRNAAGDIKPFNELLGDVADKFATYADGPEQGQSCDGTFQGRRCGAYPRC